MLFVPPPLIVTPPRSKELVAVRLPPPVKVNCPIEHHPTVIALALVIVGKVDPVELDNPIYEPELPVSENPLVIAYTRELAPVKLITRGAVTEKLEIVSVADDGPVICSIPPELLAPALIVPIVCADPIRASCAAADALGLNATVTDEADRVRFVVVVKSNTDPTPVSVQVPLPIFRVRVPVPVQLKPVAPDSVTLLLLVAKSSVPVNAPIVMD